MKPVSPLFRSHFNKAMQAWLMSKPKLHQHLHAQDAFIDMNRDEFINVRISQLSKAYFEKHVAPDPEAYLQSFIEQIRPALLALLESLNMSNYIYVILFSGKGLRVTSFVHVGTN
ncbi:hypothetical protein [Pedobacter sp. GR22-6]|uniref:hypothetical protein n=1 Tax=Pedobacter sp. GR22-6 TaxID=3127957 RepID=UPI00307CC824